MAQGPDKSGGRRCVSPHDQMLPMAVGKGHLGNITLPTTCILFDLQVFKAWTDLPLNLHKD